MTPAAAALARVGTLMAELADAGKAASALIDKQEMRDTHELLAAVETDMLGYLSELNVALDNDRQRAAEEAEERALDREIAAGYPLFDRDQFPNVGPGGAYWAGAL